MNQLEEKIKNKYPNESVTVLEFTSLKEPATIKCNKCGEISTVKQAKNFLLRKTICKNCGGNGSGGKMNLQNFQEKLNNKYPEEHLQALNYTLSTKPADIKCLDCGSIYHYEQAYYSYMPAKHGSMCKVCHPDKNDLMELTRKKFAEWIKTQDNYIDFEDFSKAQSHTKIGSICAHCGEKTFKTINKYMMGRGCATCSKRKLKTLEEFQQELPDDYQVLEYHGMEHMAKFKHLTCGFIYEKNARHHACPKCCKKESKGESSVRFFLEQHNITFKQEYMVIIEGHKLRFDFYLPEYDKYIEYQGQQHFEANPYFGGAEGFKRQVAYDNLKREYCQDKLIEISYLQDLEIANILTDSLNL